MPKIDKSLLATYVAMNNKKADEYLASLAVEIETEIASSNDNDEVSQALESLKIFEYKVPKEVKKIVAHVLKNPIQTKKGDHGIDGKTFEDIATQALDLLSDIRYYTPDDFLDFVFENAIKHDNKDIRSKGGILMKDFAKYNYHLLTKQPERGYLPQVITVRFLGSLPNNERLAHIELIKQIAKEILTTNVEGSSLTAPDTLTMHFGALDGSENLKKIRRDMTAIITDLYEKTESETDKLALIEVLNESIQTPSHAGYGEALEKMLEEDLGHLLGFYSKILLKNSEFIGSPAIAETLDHHLFWMLKGEREPADEIKALRDALSADRFYSLFSLMVGDYMMYKEENGWGDADKKRNEELDQKALEVTEANIDQWERDLNRIAASYGTIEEWKFNYFRGFIWKLGIKNPEISFSLMKKAILEDKPLKKFVWGSLMGFRDEANQRIDLWDALVQLIAEKKEVDLVEAIADSLTDEKRVWRTWKTRKEDIDILEKILKTKGEFSFLPKLSTIRLEYALLRCLISNYKAFPERIEPLVIFLLKQGMESAHNNIQTLEFGQMSGWIDVAALSPNGIKFLKKYLSELPDLEWHAQTVLLSLAKKDASVIFEVLDSRMKKKMKGKSIENFGRYTAIPFHMNRELVDFINELPDRNQRLKPLTDKVGRTWNIYAADLGKFINELGPATAESVILSVIAQGEQKDLWRAVRLMQWHLEEPNLKVFAEVVKRTDDMKIWDALASMLASVSGAWGEDGLARKFEARAVELEAYLGDSSDRVKRFAGQQINHMKIRAEDERKRAKEDRQLRKIEFEG